MKVERIDAPDGETRCFSGIKVRTLFAGKIGGITSIFLRTFSNIIDLRNPGTRGVRITAEGFTGLLSWRQIHCACIEKHRRQYDQARRHSVVECL